MNRTTIRRLITTTVAVPLALAASVATAPGALASPASPELASFVGSNTIDCDLPTEPGTGKPVSGDFNCSFTARSVVCGTVVAAGPAIAEARTCSANLTNGWVYGSAIASGAGYACSGLGSGTAQYTPEAGGPSRYIAVWLDLHAGVLTINGSYVRADDGQLFIYRANIDASCQTHGANTAGYQGTVSPF